FETRASILGRVVDRAGAPLAGATFTVVDMPRTGLPRSDVSATVASDGSFRIRLTSFPEAEAERAPAHRMLVEIQAPGTLKATREVYARPGDAVDVGVVKLVTRDPAVTVIGPAGGTASDSQGLIELIVPAGALAADVPIVITPVAARDELPALLPDNTLSMYGYVLEPSGTTFATPATIRLANYKNLPTSLEIPVGSFDPATARWEHEGVAVWDGQRFVHAVTHFSEWDTNGSEPQDLVISWNRGGANASQGKATCGAGSSWMPTGGSMGDDVSIPGVQVRGEEIGVTLNYDSGQAGSRPLGQNTPPATMGVVSYNPFSVPMAGGAGGFTSKCVASGTLLRNLVALPGSCEVVVGGGCGASGSPDPTAVKVVSRLLGQTVEVPTPVSVDTTNVQFDAYVNPPLTGGADARIVEQGLVTAVKEMSGNRGSRGACSLSGGAFGVSDPMGPRVQTNVDGGAIAHVQEKVLIQHRVTSPYGAGWAVKEMSRAYRDGDEAIVVHGNGRTEEFVPRAYVNPIGPLQRRVVARDSVTGEVFAATEAGEILQLDPANGASTPVYGGLAFGDLQAMAIAYVGGARHFVVAQTARLADVGPGGATRTLATRASTEGGVWGNAAVAARGEFVVYTDGFSNQIFSTRLSDAVPALTPLTLATGGDIGLDPKATLGGVQFLEPKGLAFGIDGSLFVASPRRHAVYQISPDG
ncbi:MAG: hypothetical protein KC657_24995, partial [Myxococcales bacterium]|nr:hypothetical protein [Myxococcales bacterium]